MKFSPVPPGDKLHLAASSVEGKNMTGDSVVDAVEVLFVVAVVPMSMLRYCIWGSLAPNIVSWIWDGNPRKSGNRLLVGIMLKDNFECDKIMGIYIYIYIH